MIDLGTVAGLLAHDQALAVYCHYCGRRGGCRPYTGTPPKRGPKAGGRALPSEYFVVYANRESARPRPAVGDAHVQPIAVVIARDWSKSCFARSLEIFHGAGCRINSERRARPRTSAWK